MLSIIVPVFNVQTYLESCIKSIINEIDEKSEIILINDGSTDNSLDICKKWSEKDKRIKLYNNTNHGVSYTRNFGIEHAKNDYIMFVDSDDELKPGWFKKITELQLADFDIIYFDKNIFSDLTQDELIEKIFGINSVYNFYSACSKIFKKSLILDNNIRFEREIINGEDLLFNLKVAITSKKMHYCNADMYMYRVNLNSATHTFNDKFFESNKIFISTARQYLAEANYDEKLINNYINYSIFNSIYIAINRICFLKNKEDIANKMKFLDDELYYNVDINCDAIKDMPLYKKVVVNLFLANKKNLAIKLVKLIRKINDIKKRRRGSI